MSLHDNLAVLAEGLQINTFKARLHCRVCEYNGSSTCSAPHYEDCPEVLRQLRVVKAHLDFVPDID